MNYKIISDILAEGAFGMTQIMTPYYKTSPADRDYYIWDAYAYILADLYAGNGIDQQEVLGLIEQFSKNYPNQELQTLSKLWLTLATQFYGYCTWDIRTDKHKLPDIIIYNLCHTSAEKKKDIPITNIDVIEMVELWAKINSYLTSKLIPRFNECFDT